MACKNKKCGKGKCGVDSAVKVSIVPDWLPSLMVVCKVLLILIVFIISSFQWGYTNDVLWQCIWCLSIIKLVELTDE